MTKQEEGDEELDVHARRLRGNEAQRRGAFTDLLRGRRSRGVTRQEEGDEELAFTLGRFVATRLMGGAFTDLLRGRGPRGVTFMGRGAFTDLLRGRARGE